MTKDYEDINNAEHPARKLAGTIIEAVVEPYAKRNIDGEEYYALEDQLTLLIDKME